MTAREVAVLGTGLMGAPMAANLAHAGHRVRVWNRSPEKAAALADAGCHVADSAADAVAGVEVVIVMLSSGPVCDAVLFGADGVAAILPEGSLLAVMSSVGVSEAQDMARKAARLGLRWVDAPVSGGTVAAHSGRLSIMAGGSAGDVEAVRPVMDAMGTTVHVGPAGAGALTKLINQLLVASTISAVSEAILLARRWGADEARVREALMGGFAASRIMDLHGQRMIDHDFVPGGPAKYQLKDTRAALEVARGLNLDLPVLALADHLFDELIAHGGGDLDHSALILELERRNGLKPLQLS